MPSWLSIVLLRIQRLTARRRVQLTRKARFEMAELGLHLSDAAELLGGLRREHSRGRFRSRATGEWLYVFAIVAAGVELYVKVVVRADCVIVSLHEDEAAPREDSDGG